MKKLVFLVEEPSMAALLDAILPRILVPGIEFKTIPHEGKSDLEKLRPGEQTFPRCRAGN
jgi:hypothetical protein